MANELVPFGWFYTRPHAEPERKRTIVRKKFGEKISKIIPHFHWSRLDLIINPPLIQPKPFDQTTPETRHPDHCYLKSKHFILNSFAHLMNKCHKNKMCLLLCLFSNGSRH